MEVEDSERTLLRHMQEFRKRPSKVSAEFFYHSRTKESWKLMERILYTWLDIYSELQSFEGTKFDELLKLVRNIRAHDADAETLRVFYLLRTRTRDIIDNKSDILEKLCRATSPKGVICRIYVSTLDGSFDTVVDDITTLMGDENLPMTRSILSSLPSNHLSYLRNKLNESHSRNVFSCPCKVSKVQRLRKIGRGIQDTKSKCPITNFMDELNLLLDALSSSSHDLSPVHALHVAAQRTDFARHFYIKFKDKIHARRPSCKELERGSGEENWGSGEGNWVSGEGEQGSEEERGPGDGVEYIDQVVEEAAWEPDKVRM